MLGLFPMGIQTFAASQAEQAQNNFALVSNLDVPGVGRVDFAIFVPQISTVQPLAVLECDGHDYHERTTAQASNDNRRDRTLQSLGIPILRFTATEVLRNTSDVGREIAQFVHRKLHENAAKEAERATSYQDGYDKSVPFVLIWFLSNLTERGGMRCPPDS
jgi:hypothetical protein